VGDGVFALFSCLLQAGRGTLRVYKIHDIAPRVWVRRRQVDTAIRSLPVSGDHVTDVLRLSLWAP
jgi:hypothetical protein